MKVIVTGSAGFIGSNLCRELLKEGHSVVGVDNYSTNYSRNQKQENTRELMEFSEFTFRELDLLTCDIEILIADSDVIFHQAGKPSVQNSWGASFHEYTENNINTTQRLLEAMKLIKVPKLVYASSSSVYGANVGLESKEVDYPHPISPYGVSKLAAENLVRLYGSEFGIETVALRYFTVFGPGQRPDMAFHKIIDSALKGESFPLHGDGTQIRDFTYIADVVKANLLAMNKTLLPGSVYNIGGGVPVSMNRVILEIEKMLGTKVAVLKVPFGRGNPRKTASDSSAAKKDLDWRPATNLKVGLLEQISWQKGLL